VLATLGFVVTSIFFAAFAATFDSFVLKSTSLKLRSFACAYYFLALAFAVWGISALLGDASLLAYSVIVGNVLLLLATLCMVAVWLQGNKSLVPIIVGASLAGLLLIGARIMFDWPAPYMSEGVLIFNSSQPVSLLLTAVFVLVWLPVNVRVARKVATIIGVAGFDKIYTYIYAFATAAAVIFLNAERVPIVILSFLIVTVCFAMLLASNIVVKFVKRDNHGRAR
jgi:hypothetical protein